MAADDAVELRSPRLCLRRLRPEDAPAIVGYRSLPEVARFQSWQSFGPDDAARLVAGQAAVRPDTPGTWLQLALVASEPGRSSATVASTSGGTSPGRWNWVSPWPRPTKAVGWPRKP
jgi:hypothetical protein